MIPCELDLTHTLFHYTTILTYEVELPPTVKTVDLNLLDDEYFKIHYVTDTISNSPADHQIPTQDKWNVGIISINVEEPTTNQGALDELNTN